MGGLSSHPVALLASPIILPVTVFKKIYYPLFSSRSLLKQVETVSLSVVCCLSFITLLDRFSPEAFSFQLVQTLACVWGIYTPDLQPLMDLFALPK